MQKCYLNIGFSFTDTDYFQFLNKTVLDFAMNNSVTVWDSETLKVLLLPVNVQNLEHKARRICLLGSVLSSSL